MNELGQCIKSRDGAGGYNVLLYDGTLLCEGIDGREADDILAKLNALVRRANALAEIEEYAREVWGKQELTAAEAFKCLHEQIKEVMLDCGVTP